MNNKITRTITEIRNSHPEIYNIFMYGSCYNLFLILKVNYPQAKAMYDPDLGHVYTSIDNSLYDISGYIPKHKYPPKLKPLSYKGSERPHRWSKKHFS